MLSDVERLLLIGDERLDVAQELVRPRLDRVVLDHSGGLGGRLRVPPFIAFEAREAGGERVPPVIACQLSAQAHDC